MKKTDIKVGAVYEIQFWRTHHPLQATVVRENFRGWTCIIDPTGRQIEINNPARFRKEITPPPKRPTDLTTPRLSPAARGITAAYYNLWVMERKVDDADSSPEAFLRAHGLCVPCHGTGKHGGDECGSCAGTGLLPPDGPACHAKDMP
jgi:hypothetical protein